MVVGSSTSSYCDSDRQTDGLESLGHLVQAAFWYGLVVHIRIYPIIYALPIILVLDPLFFQYGTKPALVNWSSRKSKSQQNSSGYDCSILCLVLLSLATNPTMDQHEARRKTIGLHLGVDGSSGSLVIVGLFA
ncbi:hypothetical protein T459_06126 [Capsicum annuum]|uniref:GPI mannosyltransferase 1 n=1 Tax=Capsicum annuum TaxID=4072 RepID=A0A2G3AA06_CAPAN|nr:hypothetical protein T459_06126 [Capsicum annuum]